MVAAECPILIIFSVLLVTVHCSRGPVKSGVDRKLEANWRMEEALRVCRVDDPMCRRQAVLKAKLLGGNQAEISGLNDVVYQEPEPLQYWTTQPVGPRQDRPVQRRPLELQYEIAQEEQRRDAKRTVDQQKLEAQRQMSEIIAREAAEKVKEGGRLRQEQWAFEEEKERERALQAQRAELEEYSRQAFLEREEQMRLDDERQLAMQLSRDEKLAEQARLERMAELDRVINFPSQYEPSTTDIPDPMIVDPHKVYHENAQRARMAELDQLKNNPVSMPDRRRIFGRAHLTSAANIPFERLGEQMIATGLSSVELEERALIRSMISLYLDMIAVECKDFEFSTKLSKLIPFLDFPETRKWAAELIASIFEIQDLYGNQNRLLNMLLTNELANAVFHPGRRLTLKRLFNLYDKSLVTTICQLPKGQIDVELARSCT